MGLHFGGNCSPKHENIENNDKTCARSGRIRHGGLVNENSVSEYFSPKTDFLLSTICIGENFDKKY